MHRKRIIAIAIVLASTSFVVGCGSPRSGAKTPTSSSGVSEHNIVNLYIWADYMAPDTLSEFERLTGIKVNVSYFDSYETLEAKILTGHSGFDVVLPTSGLFSREIRAGAYLPLDKAKLPNLHNLDPAMMAKEAISDPDSAHGVVYMTSTYGIGYNKELIANRLPNEPPNSWGVVFDPLLASKWSSCGINVNDDPVGVVDLALIFLGKTTDAPSAADYAQVEKLLA